MSMSNKAKGTIRTLKNYTKGFTELQIKARSATSNDPTGPSGALLSELARASFSHYRFVELMDIIDKRLNDSGKNWRHVFKALIVMEYLLQNGSEEVVAHCRNNLYIIKTLREFQFVDEHSKDQGANVRHKAKDVTQLLTNEQKLKEARAHLQDMNSFGNYGNDSSYGSGYGFENQKDSYGSRTQSRNASFSAEDRELAMAIEESRRMAQKQPAQRSSSETDDDLRKAIEISKREAEQRERSIAKENELVVLDDYDPNPTPKNPQTSHIKQFDFFGNIVHEPAAQAASSGSSDLLCLDPLQFTGQSQTPSFQQNNYNAYRTSGYTSNPNPFTQTNPAFPQNNQQFSQNNNFNQTSNAFSQNNGFAQTSSGYPHNQGASNHSTGNFPQNNGPFSQTAGLNHQSPQPSFDQLPTNNYTGANNSFPSNDPISQTFSPTSQNAPGFQSQFTGAFDGGFNAKPLPHQNKTNANAALASIARNSSQIDPFASLAASRSNNLRPRSGTNPEFLSGNSNPFHGTWSNAPPTFPDSVPPSQNKPNSMDMFSQPPPNNPFASFQGGPTPTNNPNNGNQNIFF
ncbi:hypothetical protein DSO57_1003653 [Entomophthora muscae]|uniref:Uncharacterized protein n=1 Tax=Entomophthora muscae TaxID=34485 RepID=A0ACC2T870_9FUNG|nr:hypothetical protein DSO57_1003653 [Entomophthora muscae]